MDSSTLFIITGTRGVGKSTFCRHLVNLAGQVGWQVSGVLSPAVFENGQKIGIDVIDLRTGEQRRLAGPRQAGQPAGTGLATQQWQFDADAVIWGNAVLQKAVPCDLLIVDELGPLEFEWGEGWPAGLAALDSGQYRWGVVVIRPELLEAARRRWVSSVTVVINSQ